MTKAELDQEVPDEDHGRAPDKTNVRLLKHAGLREKRIADDGVEQVFKIFEEEGGGCGNGSCADLQYMELDRGFPKTIIAMHVKPDDSLGQRYHIHSPGLNDLPLEEKNEAALTLVFQRLREWGLED